MIINQQEIIGYQSADEARTRVYCSRECFNQGEGGPITLENVIEKDDRYDGDLYFCDHCEIEF